MPQTRRHHSLQDWTIRRRRNSWSYCKINFNTDSALNIAHLFKAWIPFEAQSAAHEGDVVTVVLLIKFFSIPFKPKWLPVVSFLYLMPSHFSPLPALLLPMPLCSKAHKNERRGEKYSHFSVSTATAVRWPCLRLFLLSQILRDGWGGRGEGKRSGRKKEPDIDVRCAVSLTDVAPTVLLCHSDPHEADSHEESVQDSSYSSVSLESDMKVWLRAADRYIICHGVACERYKYTWVKLK